MPLTFASYDPSSVDVRQLWPLDKIRRDPLEVRVRHEELREYPTGPVLRREIIFTSHEFRGEKIRIAAQVALPQGKGPLPAMVLGAGNLDGADSFSRTHEVAVIAIDRVGTGDSNGPPDSYNLAWLDLGRDMRDGWMVQYVHNVLRAITYMQAQPEVDAARIGVTGGSRGGTMSLIVNGVDPRISLVVPTATSGDILTAFEHDGWANFLYQREDGSQGIPPAFRMFSLHGDPINFARCQHGKVMLVLGAQDEYFPIYTVKTFCDAVTGDLRLCLIPDWDHGLFSGDRPEVDTYDNREEAGKRTGAAMKYAIDCYLHQKRPMPHGPLLSWLSRDGKLEFRATADAAWPLEQAHLLYSTDGAYFFRRLPMEKIYETFREHYVASLEVTDEDLKGICFYVEAKHEDGPYLMSVPEFGMGFRQRMRVQPPGTPGPQPEFVTEELSLAAGEGAEQVVVSYDRTRENLNVVVLLGPTEGDRLSVTDNELRAEAERLAKRGLFAVGCRAAGDRAVERIIDSLAASHGKYLNDEALSLVGYSRGATVALACAARMPDRFRCAVAYSPCGGEQEVGEPSVAAPNVHVVPVWIFADLEDPSLFVGQGFADAAAAAGRQNVQAVVSHPTDGLRWCVGWPARDPVLRRTEDRFMRTVSGGAEDRPRLPESGSLVVAPRLATARLTVEARPPGAGVRLDYSIRDNRLSIRMTPLPGPELESCSVSLMGVGEVAVDGKPVKVTEDGLAVFEASPRSVVSARTVRGDSG